MIVINGERNMEYSKAIREIMERLEAKISLDIAQGSFIRIVFTTNDTSIIYCEYITPGQNGAFTEMHREITCHNFRGNVQETQALEERIRAELGKKEMREVKFLQYQPHSLTG